MRGSGWVVLALAAGCGGDKAASDDTAGDSGDSGSGETAETAETGIPDDPTPFTLSVSGAYDGDLSFDAPTCTWTDVAPNFRAFWRNTARQHVFVLTADVLGVFEGEGTYDQTMTITRVNLQEEAGGTDQYFTSDPDQGDTVSITVDHVDAEQAWGEFTFSGLHDGSDTVTVTPMPVPIWCPTMNG